MTGHGEGPEVEPIDHEASDANHLPEEQDKPQDSRRLRSTAAEMPALATETDLLDRAVAAVHRLGVHGEDRVIRLVYLAATSRLLERIVNVVVKGPSSGGKSFVTAKTLDLFPTSAYCSLTGMSE